MRDELEDALGERLSDDEARRAIERQDPTRAAWLRENRLLVLISAATALVVGAIASLAAGSVWLLVLALAAHGAGTVVVATLTIRLLGEAEKPDPMTVARLEAAGVDNPEHRLNMALRSREAA